MVNGAQTVGSVGSGAALFARASAAANLPVETAEATATAEAAVRAPSNQVVAAIGQALRYNSFEFSYRQDFGKIVLLRQKPDTGEVVQQFPSEYYLRKYADGERVAKNAQDNAADNPAPAEPQVASASIAPTADAGSDAAPAPVVSQAPIVPSAPSLSNGGTSASTAVGTAPTSVDLTI